jgi:Uma2 family endonuclease
MTTTTVITAEEFAQMTFDGPVELIDGELVEMTRPGGVHGVSCNNAAFLVETWVRAAARQGRWLSVINDTGVVTRRGPDTVRGPDVFVIRRDRLPGGKVPGGNFPVAPDLCIEVKSPHDRWSEIIQKVSEYLAIGVMEVWVIDPEHRRAHVYRADTEPDVLNRSDILRSNVLPDFVCPVDEFFRGIEPQS